MSCMTPRVDTVHDLHLSSSGCFVESDQATTRAHSPLNEPAQTRRPSEHGPCLSTFCELHHVSSGRAIGRGRCSRCSPFVQVDARYVAQMWQVFGRIVRGAVRVASHRRCRQTDASSLESELTCAEDGCSRCVAPQSTPGCEEHRHRDWDVSCRERGSCLNGLCRSFGPLFDNRARRPSHEVAT